MRATRSDAQIKFGRFVSSRAVQRDDKDCTRAKGLLRRLCLRYMVCFFAPLFFYTLSFAIFGQRVIREIRSDHRVYKNFIHHT